jgi:hypothetical protein
MTRGILIAGNDSTLFSAAAAEALKRVKSFASAIIPNRFPLPEGGRIPPHNAATPGGAEPAAIPLSWNPASSISARTLVLAAATRLGTINDALTIRSPPAVYKAAETLTPEEIEIMVNDHIKGWFYIIRELVIYFRRQGTGSLSLVLPEEAISGDKWTKGTSPGNRAWNRINQSDLLGPSAAASFRAYAQGVLAAHSGEPFQVMGFTGSGTGAEEEFAAWFFKILDAGERKKPGQWHTYSRRKFFR